MTDNVSTAMQRIKCRCEEQRTHHDYLYVISRKNHYKASVCRNVFTDYQKEYVLIKGPFVKIKFRMNTSIPEHRGTYVCDTSARLLLQRRPRDCGKRERSRAGARLGTCEQSRGWAAYLGVPAFVQVVYARHAPSVAVRVVHVAHIPRPVARVASHHRLQRQGQRGVRRAGGAGSGSRGSDATALSCVA